ncbi:hypothetical protein [Streptomyces sp. NPDC001089]
MRAWLRKVLGIDRRTAELIEAAEEFVWVWADTVNTDAYDYGASLECDEAQTLHRLFDVSGFTNTAAELLEDHRKVCASPEKHTPAEVGEKVAQ